VLTCKLRNKENEEGMRRKRNRRVLGIHIVCDSYYFLVYKERRIFFFFLGKERRIFG